MTKTRSKKSRDTVPLRSQQPDIVPIIPKFAAGVIDTGGKLPPVSLTEAANLPPVSTKLAKLMAKFAAGVVNKLPRVSLINCR